MLLQSSWRIHCRPYLCVRLGCSSCCLSLHHAICQAVRSKQAARKSLAKRLQLAFQSLLRASKIHPQREQNRPSDGPKSSQNRPGGSQERPRVPKTPPRAPKSGRRAPQEHPKSLPRGSKSAPRAPKSAPRAAQERLDTPKTGFRASF